MVRTERSSFLLPTLLCATSYCRMLDPLQICTPQGQRKHSQALTTRSLKVPLPNHKSKGVAVVVICTDLMMMRRPPCHPAPLWPCRRALGSKTYLTSLSSWQTKRRVAMRALLNIPTRARVECFTAETQANWAFLKETNVITFIDENMEVKHLDHRRPLYLAATINQILIKRSLVDNKLSMNMIPLSTLEAIEKPRSKIVGFLIEVTGFKGRGENTVGYIQLWLKVGPIASLTHFHMVKTEVSYHVLFGRPWLHKHHLIPSTYH